MSENSFLRHTGFASWQTGQFGKSNFIPVEIKLKVAVKKERKKIRNGKCIFSLAVYQLRGEAALSTVVQITG